MTEASNLCWIIKGHLVELVCTFNKRIQWPFMGFFTCYIGRFLCKTRQSRERFVLRTRDPLERVRWAFSLKSHREIRKNGTYLPDAPVTRRAEVLTTQKTSVFQFETLNSDPNPELRRLALKMPLSLLFLNPESRRFETFINEFKSKPHLREEMNIWDQKALETQRLSPEVGDVRF